MVQDMNTETITSAKRGRKPVGETAMSPAERKRRSRELSRASGVKEFSLKLQGMHLEHVEQLATQIGVTTSEALRGLLESALDRYVGVVRRCSRMLDNGATEDDVAKFMSTYWMPPLPPMPEAANTSHGATEVRITEANDELTIMGIEDSKP